MSNIIRMFVKQINVNYTCFQLIPTKSNKNNKTERIASWINKLHVSATNQFSVENKQLILKTTMKTVFYIHITKHEITFYFITPTTHNKSFHAICKDIWPHIEIQNVSTIVPPNATMMSLEYSHNDALSLSVDKRNNDLLNSNLTVAESLTDGEELGIIYNFIPMSKHECDYWQYRQFPEEIKKFKNGDSLKKKKSPKDYLIYAVTESFDFIDSVIYGMTDCKKTGLTERKNEPSSSTLKKTTGELCKVQCLLFASAKTKEREKDLIQILGNTFKAITDDNELKLSKKVENFDIFKSMFATVPVNKMSIGEVGNFISLPGTDIIQRFHMVKHNKVLERPAPETLLTGAVKIGKLKNKEQSSMIYYSSDKEIRRLGRVVMGSMGSGKSYYLKNLAKDIIADNRGLVVIDYIDKCQLSESIKSITPKDKLIEINVDNKQELQSFNFNELNYDIDSPLEVRINVAMQKAEQLQLLLDSINADNSKLTPRMLRYFYAAATLVYFVNQNASMKEIAIILKDPLTRLVLIQELSAEARELLSEEIDDLKDLTKEGKNGSLDNSDSKIDGILDRIAWLKTNLYTKIAFNKSAENNYNFVELLSKNKVILIKIPEQSFKSRMIRNVIATFFLNKIWVSKQINCDTHTELFFDEIHQCYHCQLLMTNILVECRKFQLTPTLALHYFNQLTQDCKSSLLESGASFLLLQGCNVKEFQELAIYFEKDGYTQTDLAELERYHALCLIKHEQGYSSFIVKLPE